MLKQQLCCSPVLRSPDFTKEFRLQTDASEYGVGSVLSQEVDSGDEHPVAYFSRKLFPREQKSVLLSSLLVRLSIKVYLLGRQFVDNNSQLTRWSLSLQLFEFTVKHRAGTANSNADALCRAHHPSDNATK